MSDIIIWIKLIFAGICGGLTYIFGGLDAVLKILIIMMAIDYITGVCVAIYRKELCSRTGFNGILKKAAILCIVACAHMIGEIMNVAEIRSAVIGFYIANEGISIVENAASLGVPMPQKLIDILNKFKETEENANDL
ncbi:MAG: phage holin family protein [Clostridia bacterium]|nr:phage holin family protein [Clostridia bacterium]